MRSRERTRCDRPPHIREADARPRRTYWIFSNVSMYCVFGICSRFDSK